MTVVTMLTADELLRLPADGWRYELVRGELRKMSPSGARHGRVAAEIVGSLIAHMKVKGVSLAASLAGLFLIRRALGKMDCPSFPDGLS